MEELGIERDGFSLAASYSPAGATALVAVQTSVEAWRARRGSEVEIEVVPDAEHDPTLPSGSLAPRYERMLVDWLRRQAR